jgi:hypothetical protein
MNIEEVRGGGSDGERRCGPWVGPRKRMRRRGGVEEPTAKVSECEDEKRTTGHRVALTRDLTKHMSCLTLEFEIWYAEFGTLNHRRTRVHGRDHRSERIPH